MGVHYLRQALAVTGTAASYIRSAAQGYVVLIGEGVPLPGHPIKAPFSGKPCVWWSTQVEALMRSNHDPVPNSDAFDKHFSSLPFLLRDGSGECIVYPEAADVRVKSRDVWYGNSMTGGSIHQAQRTRSLTDDLQFVEERIELHQRIVANGYFQTTHTDPGTNPPPGAAPGTNMLGPPPDDRHFLISTISEETLAQDLRLRAVLAFLSCAVLAGCAMLAGRAG